jgi:hypothetical protein
MSKVTIDLNDELIDKFILSALKDQIGYVKKEIKPINKKMKEYQIADIKNAKEALEHLEYVYDYYGGNVK